MTTQETTRRYSAPPKAAMPERFIRLPEVIEMTGRCRSSILKAAADGTMPRQVKTGGRSSAWLLSEIQAWMQEKIDQRDQEAKQ